MVDLRGKARYQRGHSAHFSEGPEGGMGTNPITQLFFFQIPLRNSQNPLPFLIFNIFFSHSQ